MSSQYFKVKLEEETIYIKEINSTDYVKDVDENGEYVECRGTYSYIKMLGHALLLEEYDGAGFGESCEIEEVGFATLPEKVKEELG